MVPFAVYPLPEVATTSVLVFLLLVGLAVPIYLLFYRPVGDSRMWGMGEMLAITILFLFVLPVAGAMAGLDGPEQPLTLAALSIATIWQNLLFVVASGYVVMVRYGLTPSRLGVRFDRWPLLVLVGVIVGGVTIPLAVGSERVAVYLLGLVEGPAAAAARAVEEHLSDPLRPILGGVGTPLGAAWILFLLAVVVPIGEEVFFRGLVYGGLRGRWGIGRAMLASGIFFTLVHIQVVHALPILVLGCILAALYERSGSLLPGIVTHSVNNIVAVISMWKGWGL